MKEVHQIPQDRSIQEAINELDSLSGSESAVEKVVALGKLAIPHLEYILLDCPPRTISIPRCRAACALGELGAYSVLSKYFLRYERPADSAVLFAEDAVRSVAAKQLARIRREEVYHVLLDATRQRATSGLVQALGTFRRHESVPLLFQLLEDDLCRIDALAELRKVPNAARPYAILLLRGCTGTPIRGTTFSRRRHSTLQLLVDFHISEGEWPEIRQYLHDEDLDCIVAAARLGLCVVRDVNRETIVEALIEASARMNWAQEMEVIEILDQYRYLAQPVARTFARRRRLEREKPNWLSPFWRILHHVLGSGFECER